MSAAVIVSPEAEAQARAIDRWWRENREAAPGLFAQELAATLATLRAMPSIGRVAPHPELSGLRRILMRATRFHIYYVTNQDAVLVLAIWSAVMGSGPDLKTDGGADLL